MWWMNSLFPPQAIALAKVLDGSSKQDDFTEHLSGFYLLKYGTSQPALARQDSTVRNMKYYATFKDQRKRLSGKKKTGEQGESSVWCWCIIIEEWIMYLTWGFIIHRVVLHRLMNRNFLCLIYTIWLGFALVLVCMTLYNSLKGCLFFN